jgi:hypothetical protein
MPWRAFQFEPVRATQEEQWAARDAWRGLGSATEGVVLHLVRDGKAVSVALPAAAVRVLRGVLDGWRRGMRSRLCRCRRR